MAEKQVKSSSMQKYLPFRCAAALLLLLSFPTIVWADTPVPPPKVAIVQDAGPLKTLQAEALVDAPMSVVWQELIDYPNLKRMFPGYERTTVLQASGNTATVDLQVKASSLLAPFRYQVRIQEDKPSHTLTIQRISGDFKSINASYRLVPVDGGNRTRVLYQLSIDVGSLPVPGVSSILKNNTAKSMASIQGRCADVYRRSLTAQAVR